MGDTSWRIGVYDRSQERLGRALQGARSEGVRDRLLGRKPALSQIPGLGEPSKPAKRFRLSDIEVRNIIARAEKVRQAKVPSPVPKISVRDVLEAVAGVTGYSLGDLLGPCRNRPMAKARALAAYLLKTLRPDMSLPAIGRGLARDHTTILYQLRRMEKFRDEFPVKEWLADARVRALLEGGK